MTAQTLYPLALWQEGTNQNSTPANDNALRIEAIAGPAKGFAGSAPSSPAERDQWIVSVTWGGHAVDNIVIYTGGTWKEFAVYNGMFKSINNVPYYRHVGYWDILLTSGS